MSHPMPIGGMQLELLPLSILRAKKDRGTLTDTITKKMVAMLAYLNEDRYCLYLVSKGLMSSCEDPEVPPPPAPKVEDYKSERYVYELNKDPYRNWDFTGQSVWNER
jgi:hypothetical protein